MLGLEMLGLDILGGDKLETELTGLALGLDNPQVWLGAEGAKIAGEGIRENFEQGGRPDKWPDITAWSRAMRKVNHESGPLIDTGALMAAASASEPGVEGSIFRQQGDTLTLGTDLEYAADHEFGTARIPVREFMSLTPEDEIRLTASMDDDYLHKLLAQMS